MMPKRTSKTQGATTNEARVLSNPTPWDLIQAGKVQAGLRVLRAQYDAVPEDSEAMELGVAYLWSRKYNEALKHFDYAIANAQWSMDCYYAMAGVARWCLGDTDAAVMQWKLGLKAQYGDMAGGVDAPMLLFTAAVLQPQLILMDEVVSVIEKKAKKPDIMYWPGPLAKFLVGQIDEAELQTAAQNAAKDDAIMNAWLIGFYKGVIFQREGRRAAFKRAMKATSDAVSIDDPDRNMFFTYVWHPEFYLARHLSQ